MLMLFGGNGLFSLFNLANGVLWIAPMVVFPERQTRRKRPATVILIPSPPG